MKKFYIKNAALALGVVALAGSAFAAETEWQDVTGQYLKNPSMVTPDWNGGFATIDQGVAETWSMPFGIVQTLNLPAGKYTMSVNAFYRYGGGDFAEANTADNLNAFVFMGTKADRYAAKAPVMSLYAEDGVRPNNMAEAADAFKAGKYVNKIEFTHPGGDLSLGIANPADLWDQWCCFGFFKLEGPNGAVEIPNGDFSKGLLNFTDCGWDNANIGGSEKFPDHFRSPNSGKKVEGGETASDYELKGDFNQWNAAVAGTFRKAGGSAYNHGQLVSLPAGTYRFGSQSFIRYGCGNQSGWWVAFKNGYNGDTKEFFKEEGKSAWDLYQEGTEDSTWPAYLYATNGWDTDENDAKIKPATKDDALSAEYGNPNGFYNETKIKNLFDEEKIGDKYPDNVADPNQPVDDTKKVFVNSGFEAQSVEYLINNPNSYRNYVEFTLEEPADVWVGIKKDVNAPAGYWHVYREFTLEKAQGGSSVSEIVVDENAPVEYFNLQGVRVAAPENGIFIVKQGKKVAKQIFK